MKKTISIYLHRCCRQFPLTLLPRLPRAVIVNAIDKRRNQQAQMDRPGLHAPGLRSTLPPHRYAPRIPPMPTYCAERFLKASRIERFANQPLPHPGPTIY
jgi:hypothetical protein